MQTLKKFLFLGLCAFSVVFFPLSIEAQGAPNLRNQINSQIDAGTNASGLGKADPRSTVAGVIQIILSTVGIIFTGLVVLSGYNILTAGGDEGKVEKAKKTIEACVVGLIIVLGAYSITSFISKSAQDAVNNTVETQADDRLDVVDDWGWGDWGWAK